MFESRHLDSYEKTATSNARQLSRRRRCKESLTPSRTEEMCESRHLDSYKKDRFPSLVPCSTKDCRGRTRGAIASPLDIPASPGSPLIMLTLICSLKFADGAVVTGRVTAMMSSERKTVEYSGAIERLQPRFDRTSPPLPRALFRDLAKELGAEYSESFEGEYDYAE
jgi:hypothetical protein